MNNQKLHPSVEEFKKFVNDHPKILDEVKNGEATLQELYEDWYLLGEDDVRWKNLLSGEKKSNVANDSKSDWLNNVIGSIKKMDSEQVQHYITQLSQALSSIQGVLSQFQSGNSNNSSNKPQQKPNHPFSFRKD
jgi:hypothetical protein